MSRWKSIANVVRQIESIYKFVSYSMQGSTPQIHDQYISNLKELNDLSNARETVSPSKPLIYYNAMYQTYQRAEELLLNLVNIISTESYIRSSNLSITEIAQCYTLRQAMHKLYKQHIRQTTAEDAETFTEINKQITNPTVDIIVWINNIMTEIPPPVNKFTIAMIQMNIARVEKSKQAALITIVETLIDKQLNVTRYKLPFKGIQALQTTQLRPITKHMTVIEISRLINGPYDEAERMIFYRISTSMCNVVTINCASKTAIDFDLSKLMKPDAPTGKNPPRFPGLTAGYIQKYNTVQLREVEDPVAYETVVYPFKIIKHRDIAPDMHKAAFWSNIPINDRFKPDDIIGRHANGLQPQNEARNQPDPMKPYAHWDNTKWLVFQTQDNKLWRLMSTGDLANPSVDYKYVKNIIEGVTTRPMNYNAIMESQIMQNVYDKQAKLIHQTYSDSGKALASTEPMRNLIVEAMSDRFNKKHIATLKDYQTAAVEDQSDIILKHIPQPILPLRANTDHFISRVSRQTKLLSRWQREIEKHVGRLDIPAITRMVAESPTPQTMFADMYREMIIRVTNTLEEDELWRFEHNSLKDILLTRSDAKIL